jgi:hypothetical protein
MRGALVILLLAAPAYADTGPHKEGQYDTEQAGNDGRGQEPQMQVGDPGRKIGQVAGLGRIG